MKIDILGLGESLKEFKPSSNIAVGVNDIAKHYNVDYLIVVDRPKRFAKDRLQTIINSKPKKFYTQLDDWKDLVENYNQIVFSSPRGSIKGIESDTICYSNNSTYIAVVIAYKMGAKEINIFGADFNTHPNFKDNGLNKVLKDFKQLFNYLKSRNVKVNVTEISRLREVL